MANLRFRVLIPRCDRHPEAVMEPRSARSRNVAAGEVEVPTELVMYVCVRPECKRIFWLGSGYTYADSPYNQSEMVCEQHGDNRQYLVLHRSEMGFRYVCPVEGCTYTKAYPAAKGIGA
jgi:hypothetical protein